MTVAWAVIPAGLLYLSILFAIAHWGDRHARPLLRGVRGSAVYALSLGVFCTAWTFYGTVGFASRSGLDFLAIYIGPILVIGLGHTLVARVVRIAKAQNITSVADFVAARYGKSEGVAALVAGVAVVAAIPYIALQLKAVSASLDLVLSPEGAPLSQNVPLLGDVALVVALGLAGFAVAFGTRHADATEHQDGLMMAISLESIVKLVAFLAVGIYVAFWMFDGPADIASRLAEKGLSSDLFASTSGLGSFLTLTLLAACAALLMPRQFHMGVVENRAVEDVKRAAWLFPAYLLLTNIFVIPLTLAGLAAFPEGTIDRDMTVLALPFYHGAGRIALIAFIGGFSAATAMVIVESVAVAIMISNHLVVPLILRRRAFSGVGAPQGERLPTDLSGVVLEVRRVAIVLVILLAYAYHRVSGEAGLAALGLLSFAAIAQIAPAFVGALFWGRGTAVGAVAGLALGLGTWAYTLLLPSLVAAGVAGADLVVGGPFGIEALRPTALLGTELPQLTHGVIWSLSLNILGYVGFSLLKPPNALERLQAKAFVGEPDLSIAPTFRLLRANVTVEDVRATVARYLGVERTTHSFEAFARSRGQSLDLRAHADIHLLRYAEHLLASAIGAASSRLALSLLLRRRNVSTEAALKLLDDVSAAIQYSRDVLQHAIDHARQGITVLDRDLQLVAWNRAFVDLYELPPEMVRVGIGLEEVIRFNAERGSYGPGPIDEIVAARLHGFVHDLEPVRLRLTSSGKVIEIRTNPLPDGGFVTTYTDVTETVVAEEARERANEILEQRVHERTEELTRLNQELRGAKAEAEEANLSKTRFLAAASHDILQPLNAARLYASSLVERDRDRGDPALAYNVDASLEAVEEILTALLDISRLDAGAMKPQWSVFRIDELFRQLQLEFEPSARASGLTLTFVPSSLAVHSDRRLLRRLLQNLISNAIKYTPSGRVLVGVRRRAGKAVFEVWDTGLGIPESKQALVFREFQRLDSSSKMARGLGLGLSIVQRLGKVLEHSVSLQSSPGNGTVFRVGVPVAEGTVAPSLPRAESRTPATPLSGLRVLVIDNEPSILDSMRLLLQGWGCVVSTTTDRVGAFAAAAEETPDAILADYHLDEGNGLDVIKALRETMPVEVPAVLLTADRSAWLRDTAGAVGVHILNKPVKPAALRALLVQWRTSRMAAE